MAKRQYSGPWRTVRKQILKRDGNVCQIRGPKCTVIATEVDHIVPVLQGGPLLDPANLRAACRKCNRGRVDSSHKNRWRSANTYIYLVVGPPFAGKSQYVADHASDNDIIIDYDSLSHAVGGSHAATVAARNALLTQLRQGTLAAGRAWITSADPMAESLYPWHEVVVVDPGEAEIVRRINTYMSNGNSAGASKYIHDGASDSTRLDLASAWYTKRNESASGPVVPSREW